MRNLVADFEKAAQLGKPIPQEVLMAADDASRSPGGSRTSSRST